MRTVRPSRELKEWELKGWTREPRNGYEWKRLKAGLPQPKGEITKRWKKPYNCKNCGPGKPFKVIVTEDKVYRRCIKCENDARQAYCEKHKQEHKKYRKKYRQIIREREPLFVDGMFTIPSGWFQYNLGKIPELLQKGDIVVEVWGEPAYVVTSLEKYRKFK